MAIYTEMLDTITAYTGLSPPAFFSILAASVFVYCLVSNMFVSPVPKDNNNTITTTFKNNNNINNNNNNTSNSNNTHNAYVVREPVHLGDDMTEDELRGYDGSDPDKPLLMAIKGMIYDVSRSRMFYGPGGPYALFAGRDASRALALMSFEPKHLTGNIEGLSPSELEVLQDWEYKFMEKYVKVGQLASSNKHPDPVENDDQISKNVEENGEQGGKVPSSE